VARLFSMFPSGRPGIALLILRVSVAAMLLAHGRISEIPAFSSVFLVVLLLALSLCLGFATPLAATLYCIAGLALLPNAVGFDTKIIVLSIPNAVVLALLGPGAYSLDARLFGRRVIVLSSGDSTRRG
jgi:hypothetical protein